MGESGIARVLPHVIDTILLGVVALRQRLGRAPPTPDGIRLASWLSALLVFGYIVSVALTKNPRGLLALLR